jgi:rRNA maturation RNase YbeY
MSKPFTIAHTTSRPIPDIPFRAIKNSIVGNRYAVSLVFVGKARAHTLNMKWRNKSYVPDVLSFEVDTMCGEVYITPLIALRDAAMYGHTYREHIAFLFIHALLHLKGYEHGDTMEEAEAQYMKRYIRS